MEKKVNSGKYTEQEFLHLDDEQKIMEMGSMLNMPEKGKSEDEALRQLLGRIEEPIHLKGRVINMRRLIQIAAAVVLILGSAYVILNNMQGEAVITRFSQQSEMSLPDGSFVAINADSKLSWTHNYTTKRRLKLSGEAFFDVEKGTPFVVKTKHGTVEVLGTELNIFDRNDQFWVSCISGKVQVSVHDQKVIIVPGEKVQLVSGKLKKSQDKKIERTIAWKEGMFYFEDEPLRVIFDVLERQFDVKIIFTGDTQHRMTTQFNKGNLREVLDIICIPMALSYEIENEHTIFIKPQTE